MPPAPFGPEGLVGAGGFEKEPENYRKPVVYVSVRIRPFKGIIKLRPLN